MSMQFALNYSSMIMLHYVNIIYITLPYAVFMLCLLGYVKRNSITVILEISLYGRLPVNV